MEILQEDLGGKNKSTRDLQMREILRETNFHDFPAQAMKKWIAIPRFRIIIRVIYRGTNCRNI